MEQGPGNNPENETLGDQLETQVELAGEIGTIAGKMEEKLRNGTPLTEDQKIVMEGFAAEMRKWEQEEIKKGDDVMRKIEEGEN